MVDNLQLHQPKLELHENDDYYLCRFITRMLFQQGGKTHSDTFAWLRMPEWFFPFGSTSTHSSSITFENENSAEVIKGKV